jgi:hypothetical protein
VAAVQPVAQWVQQVNIGGKYDLVLSTTLSKKTW